MNRLIHSKSLYLQQHAANPVHWWPWCEEAWNLAKSENKLVIVSIGYSACHWCHVMEHEVFEDDGCAEIMNRDFISIKVDREQHPQVDATYMDALHLMGKQGGWPLNIIATPEGIPVHGGTYIPRPHWLAMLRDLNQIYRADETRVEEFAHKIKSAMQALYAEQSDASLDLWNALEDVLVKWSRRWDHSSGGDQRAPKFPMADEYMLMLMLASAERREDFSRHVQRTLERIYAGGIFDAIGGGICRYSVDDHWHIPHFEKMLYDNARMLGVYAQASRCFHSAEFLWAAREIWDFLLRDMKHAQGHFCASIDADSSGSEGAFYVWSKEEWEANGSENAARWSLVFGIGKHAHWEHGNQVLFRRETWATHAESLHVSAVELKQDWEREQLKLREYRNRREAPAIDQKCVLSWNAILISSLVDVFYATGEEEFLAQAESLFHVLWSNVNSTTGKGDLSIGKEDAGEELLEDYANLARAALSLFYATGGQTWANKSKLLVERACSIFDDYPSALLLQSTNRQGLLFIQRKDREDNVLSSANSVMCGLLFELDDIFYEPNFRHRAERMLQHALSDLTDVFGSARWLWESLVAAKHRRVLIVAGANAARLVLDLRKFAPIHWVISPLTQDSELAIHKHKYKEQDTIYVCANGQCQKPIFPDRDAKSLVRYIQEGFSDAE